MIFRIAMLALATTTMAPAQTSNFDLESGSRHIGRSTFTLSKAKQGYRLVGHVDFRVNGMDSDFSDDLRYSEAYAYIAGSTSSNTTQMYTSFQPNKTRTELVIGMVQGGAQDSRHLVIKPDFTIMPANDAGAAQVMLLLATTHPTEKNLYNIVVPAIGSIRQRGASEEGAEATTAPAGNFAYDALWTRGPDAHGTLDGKPVALHSYILTAGRNTWTFFADDANDLMQLDNSMVKTSCIRSGFKLDLTP